MQAGVEQMPRQKRPAVRNGVKIAFAPVPRHVEADAHHKSPVRRRVRHKKKPIIAAATRPSLRFTRIAAVDVRRTQTTEARRPARNSSRARAPTASSRACRKSSKNAGAAERARRNKRQISRCARRAVRQRSELKRARRRATPASGRSETRSPTASPPRNFAERRAAQAARSRRMAGLQCAPSRMPGKIAASIMLASIIDAPREVLDARLERC